jgi:hypothetical protein
MSMCVPGQPGSQLKCNSAGGTTHGLPQSTLTTTELIRGAANHHNKGYTWECRSSPEVCVIILALIVLGSGFSALGWLKLFQCGPKGRG